MIGKAPKDAEQVGAASKTADQRVNWPVWSGVAPPVTQYLPRPESGYGLSNVLEPGTTTVLTDGRGAVIGGTGKTQMAAAFAHSLWEARAIDLLVWVIAAGRDSVLTGYAQAHAEIGAAGAGAPLERASERFLEWLAGTDRRWLVVLDDLNDPEELDGLWPRGMSGQVLVTTRLGADAIKEHGRRIVKVGVFSVREATVYLNARTGFDTSRRIGAMNVAAELGYLPVALAYAETVMAELNLGCRDYATQLSEGATRLADAVTDGAHAALKVAWSMAVDRANQLPPAGVAWPLLVLGALLDPNGIPGRVFTGKAVHDYLARCLGEDTPRRDFRVQDALENLARLGLITLDPRNPARTVRVHELTQAMVRANIQDRHFDIAAKAAGKALLEAWPDDENEPLAAQALRDCTVLLHQFADRVLWSSPVSRLLFQAGASMNNAKLARPALSYWRRLAESSGRILGPVHADTLTVHDNLASAYEATGHWDEAIRIRRDVITDRERFLGMDHPDTLSSRAALANAYHHAGEAAEALRLFQRTLADRERMLGPDHPDTLNSRSQLATAFRLAGQAKQALPLYERTLADRERVLGADHPDTLNSCGQLAYCYRLTGKLKQALVLYERTLDGRERVLGVDHPDTLTSCGNFAAAYLSAGRLNKAIPLYEDTLEGRERVLGADHPDTLTSRGNLASAYHSAGRLADAIPLYEGTLAGCERVLGADHTDTLTSRANLASAYQTALRLVEAISLFQHALAECERVLGPGHPLTRTVRENLDAARGA